MVSKGLQAQGKALPPGEGGQFPLSKAHFTVLRDLLHQHSGISLGDHKVPMVQSRLNKRLRALGLENYEAYVSLLRSDPDGEEWTHFINAMTTNLTGFFRENHHFEHLVPWVLETRKQQRRIKVWSAGCSTGEEPYTLAMVLRAGLPEWDIQILATDLDSNVLATAREGIYPEARLEPVSEAWKRFAFLRGKGVQAGQVRVRQDLRQLIEFRRLNLLHDPFPPPGHFDVIFCRNTMIYFEKPAQRELIGRFRQCLSPGGLLVVGHSESLLDAGLGFLSLGETMYQRAEGRP